MNEYPQLIDIDGQNFVLGLFWQPVTDSENLKEYVKTQAQDLGFDLYVLRAPSNSSNFSVGFAKSESIQSKSFIYSAAAAISECIEEKYDVRDFLFAGQLPDGRWYYVAQKEGSIIPDGDLVSPSEDAIRSHMYQHISMGEWRLIIAPRIWGVDSADEFNFIDILPKKKNNKIKVNSKWKVSYVNPKLFDNKVFRIGFVIILLLSVALGYVSWEKDKERKMQLAIQAAMEQEQLRQKQKKVVIEHPWKSEPTASSFVNSCLSALNGLIIYPGNWEVDKIICSGSGLQISWNKKDYGWIEHIREILPGITISHNGKTATLLVPLSGLQSGLDEQIPNFEETIKSMYASSQEYGFDLSVQENVKDNPVVLPGQENLRQVSQDTSNWREINWKVKDALLPDVVSLALDRNGFRIGKMEAILKNGVLIWEMEGKQYVQK